MAGRAPKPRRPAPGPRGTDGSRDTPRFAVVAARFNERITKRLLEGALGAFAAAGLPPDGVDVHWVPGSFELPQAASHLAQTGRYAAIVCVGCVIRGQTPHFDLVAGQAAAGIERVALETGVPTTFGVITALNEEQAWERAGGSVGNRGEDAAEAALEMAAFVRAQSTPEHRAAVRSRGRVAVRAAGRPTAEASPRSGLPQAAPPEASPRESARRRRPDGKHYGTATKG